MNIILILLLYFYSWTRRQDLVPHRCAIQDTRGKLTREEGEKRGRINLLLSPSGTTMEL